MTKYSSLLEDFQQALLRLNEILQEEKSEITRDAAIKRFELVFELGWKTLKTYLEEVHNATCMSPISCFKEAFQKGVIKYDDFWVNITKTRNLTSHTYDEETAEKVYKELPEVLKRFQELYDAMNKDL